MPCGKAWNQVGMECSIFFLQYHAARGEMGQKAAVDTLANQHQLLILLTAAGTISAPLVGGVRGTQFVKHKAAYVCRCCFCSSSSRLTHWHSGFFSGSYSRYQKPPAAVEGWQKAGRHRRRWLAGITMFVLSGVCVCHFRPLVV